MLPYFIASSAFSWNSKKRDEKKEKKEKKQGFAKRNITSYTDDGLVSDLTKYSKYLILWSNK